MNVILSDCDESEIIDFKKALEESSKTEWSILVSISNWGRNSIWKKIKRYLVYFIFPFKIFINRKKYKKIIGWQQFYAIIFAFYCKLFHVKKSFQVHAVNFTYKKKSGFAGKIYYLFVKSVLKSGYIDYVYVPSYEYIDLCSKELEISKKYFRVLPFGIIDLLEKYNKSNLSNDYILAIGRSNRDYDWLLEKWKKIDYKLIIISDSFKPNYKLPDNVQIIDNVSGDKQYPFIIGCKALIIPIKENSICSGDTVLLTAMSFKKNVIVTKGSTLAEMYIKNGKNGFIVDKKSDELITIVKKIVNNKIDVGKEARKDFLDNYSRYKMGIKMASYLEDKNG